MSNHTYTEDIKKGKIDRSNFDANIKFLDETGLLIKDIKILEIGCGAGRMTDYLTRKGFRVVGFDISKNLIKEGQVRYPGTLKIIASGNAIPFRDSSFDIVMSFDVLEHLPDVNEHIAEVGRVLKSCGFYLFQTPNKITNTVFEIMKNKSLNKHKKYHCSLQTYWSLKKLLSTHNFEFTFKKIPVMNEFMEEKIEKVFGGLGVFLLRIGNPDRLPVPLGTNFYVKGKKK